MKNSYKRPSYIFFILMLLSGFTYSQEPVDTSYSSLATPTINNMIIMGRAPIVTIQVSGYYDIGLMDMASEDNTIFNLIDFRHGRNFGTRYGFGFEIKGKFALHKQGNIRLTGGFSYNRFQSNFIVASPDGKVSYNVFSPFIGIENSFTPDRRFKPYIGLEIIPSIINGHANFDTTNILTPNVPVNVDLSIKNAFRFGFAVEFGFEYSFSNYIGWNLGMKITHANVFGRESKIDPTANEIYLNDEKIFPYIPYAGWKQFVFSSFFTGINFYFGMKDKR
ncbi:MAG: hypothetical protein ABSF32_10365 [Ignavibacteria bacterium]